jgi:hypothetical protein
MRKMGDGKLVMAAACMPADRKKKMEGNHAVHRN